MGLLEVSGYSQKIVSVSNPLEEYFQKNYDSTIFLYKSNKIEPFIYIISKKGNKLYNYRYIYSTYEDLGVLDKKFELGPLNKELKDFFTNRLEKFKKSKPSINQYFTYFDTDSISNIKITKESHYYKEGEVNVVYSPLWLLLQNFDLWNLSDQSNDDLGKYNLSNTPTKDNEKDIFKLITKNEVKKLEYKKLDRPYIEKNELRKKISNIIEIIWMNLTRVG